MAWLKAYGWEKETYPAFRDVKLCSYNQRKIVKKLARHFKLPPHPVIRLVNSTRFDSQRGLYYSRSSTIKLGETTTLATVCHEFAHHMDAIHRSGKTDHSKAFKRELKKVYTFAKRYLPQVDEEAEQRADLMMKYGEVTTDA